jgi:hypothetical protein
MNVIIACGIALFSYKEKQMFELILASWLAYMAFYKLFQIVCTFFEKTVEFSSDLNPEIITLIKVIFALFGFLFFSGFSVILFYKFFHQ